MALRLWLEFLIPKSLLLLLWFAMLEITEKISPTRPSLAYLNRRTELSRTIRPEGYIASRERELYIYVFTTKVWCVVCRLNDLTWPESIACWKILLKAAPSWLSMALAVYICEFFVVSSSPHITFDSFFFVARASLFSFPLLFCFIWTINIFSPDVSCSRRFEIYTIFSFRISLWLLLVSIHRSFSFTVTLHSVSSILIKVNDLKEIELS